MRLRSIKKAQTKSKKNKSKPALSPSKVQDSAVKSGNDEKANADHQDPFIHALLRQGFSVEDIQSGNFKKKRNKVQ